MIVRWFAWFAPMSLRSAAGPARVRGLQGTGAPRIARGSGAPSLARVVLAAIATTLAALGLTAAPALAAHGHVFTRSFTPSGPQALNKPAGVAVNEATGDVYVVDQGNNRVEYFNEKGELQGQFTGPGATGEGMVMEGLTMIEFVAATSGVFGVGEEITGKGIPAGTTIVGIPASGTLEISNPVEAGQLAETVALTAHQSFVSPDDVAIDNTCSLHSNVSIEACASDPSAGDVYVEDPEQDVVDKFNHEGVYLGQLPAAGTRLEVGGIGVDSRGRLWVAGAESVSGYSDSEPKVSLGTVPATQSTYNDNKAGFAVDSEGDFYLHANTDGGLYGTVGPIYKTGPEGYDHVGGVGSNEGELINPTFDSEGSNWLAVELSSDDVYVGHGDAFDRRAPDGSFLETLGSEPGPGHLTEERGVAVDVTTGTVFVAEASANAIEEYGLQPPGPPLIEGEGVSNVTGSSATLAAEINPRSETFEPGTEYRFEYGACASLSTCASSGYEHSAPVPDALLGASYEVDSVSVNVQGLSAGTVYHYRVVATNHCKASEPSVVCATDGERNDHGEAIVHTFTTQVAGGGSPLLDGRQWELVSPADKHGALLLGLGAGGGLAQAAVGGDAMTFLAVNPTESDPSGYANEVQVLSTRGPDGWVSRDISLPHEHQTPGSSGQGEEYMAFSEDLSSAVVKLDGAFEPSLSPEASEQTPYLRTLFVGGDVNDPCVNECFRPLATGKPGYANVAPGYAFGEEGRCPPEPTCGPVFRGATPDLSHIALYSDPPLLAGSGQAEEYEWDEGRLSQGNHLPELQASKSEDGSWSYFISGSALAPGAEPEQCGNAGAGLCNLYVSEGGVTRLVAVLSDEDAPDWSGEPSNSRQNGLQTRSSRVSPDGRWFAFMSQRELTGYNTHDAISGKPDEEVYLYHAPENLASGVGTLVCASCSPTGARPIGREVSELKDSEHHLAVASGGGPLWHETQWIAANVPGWQGYAGEAADYQSRYLSDSGRLFFDSNDALVAQDVNGNEDVYEYEPPGVGDCTTVSALFGARSGGCVGLVSSGQATGESAFLDASGNGSDVFFLTVGRLVPQDYDTAPDVYDARECTSEAPCFPEPAAVPPPCDTGDACKPAPTPQPAIYGSPSSETFSGAGNVTPEGPAVTVKTKAKDSTKAQKLARVLRSCRAKRGARRRACERQARARFARRSTGTAKKGRR
jgi:DNA-binding beta-propeller fold protein YncE